MKLLLVFIFFEVNFLTFNYLYAQDTISKSETNSINKESHDALKNILPDIKELIKKEEAPWHQNPDVWSSFTSIAAFVLSGFALYRSNQQFNEQKKREKREELRGLIEKLILIRDDLNYNIGKNIDYNERANQGSSNNTKRQVYLQSAEELVEELGEVTSSEYFILGYENEMDSDFLQARNYYEKAVISSSKSSLTNQMAAWRALAGSYFWIAPYQNFQKGRDEFRKSIEIIEDMKDLQLIYIKGYTYRYWAGKEFACYNIDEAVLRINDSLTTISSLPNWYTVKIDELRYIAEFWRSVAGYYWQNSNIQNYIEKAQNSFQAAISALQNMQDETAICIYAHIYSDWGYYEYSHGSKDKGKSYLMLARNNYYQLLDNFPNKMGFIKKLEKNIYDLHIDLDIV